MGSRFDDWIHWTPLLQLTANYNNSHIELLLNDAFLTNLSLFSDSSLLLNVYLSNSRIHCLS
jgi:hypothetical protein